ncbi:MAG: AraC family transcriptional regulator, partial [Alistipes sp.]
MFVCGPKNILQVNSANNFHSDVLVVSPTLLRDSHINTKNMMPLFIEFGSHPCLPLSGADIMALHNLIKQIDTEVQVPSTTFFTAEVIGSLISAAISKIGDIMTRYMAQHPEVESLKRNRAEEYFKQFMLLLADHYKQERSVTFYARQMCITPKYLTTLIKRLSGKSVSGWIDDYVMLEAKTLLKYSTMGIQEISYYLNFPNQSFFGSYFKRNAGMSPSQYKIK